MASGVCVFLVALSVLTSYGDCACSNVSVLSAQLDSLLAEYDRELPPAGTVSVQVTVDVRHATIKEQTNTMRLLADLHLSWQDSRISWNATDWGCEWALASGERLWTPDVTLVNAAANSAAVGEDTLAARVTSTGTVAWSTRLDVGIPVDMRLEDWPNDVQEGVFKFASRGHSVDEIDLTIKNTKFVTVFESGAWEIVSLNGKMDSLPSVVEGESKRIMVSWHVTLRRRAPSQALAAKVALVTALLLLGAAALLPPTSRAPLSAAAALVVAIWLCGAVWRLPGGVGAPRAVCALGAVCAAAGAAAAAAALVLHVARLSSSPPRLVRSAVAAASRAFTLTPPPEGTGGECVTWVAAARILDAALLVLLALVLFMLLCVYL